MRKEWLKPTISMISNKTIKSGTTTTTWESVLITFHNTNAACYSATSQTITSARAYASGAFFLGTYYIDTAVPSTACSIFATS